MRSFLEKKIFKQVPKYYFSVCGKMDRKVLNLTGKYIQQVITKIIYRKPNVDTERQSNFLKDTVT